MTKGEDDIFLCFTEISNLNIQSLKYVVSKTFEKCRTNLNYGNLFDISEKK